MGACVVGLRPVLVAGLVLLSSSWARAGQDDRCPEEAFKKVRAPIGPRRPTELERQQILAESHTLSALLRTDLVLDNPLMIATAAQRLNAIHRLHPPGPGEYVGFSYQPVRSYPLYHSRLPVNGGNNLVGQWHAVEAFVQRVEGAATAPGQSPKVLTLVGPPGTGKTLFTEIPTNFLRHYSYFGREAGIGVLYTVEWFDLLKIPELAPYASKIIGPDGMTTIGERPLRSEIMENPVALLPVEFQQEIRERVADRFEAVTGAEPLESWRIANPKNAEIRAAIIDHYRRTEGAGRPANAEQVLEWLDRHVRIVRHVLGGEGDFKPVIPYQDRDVNLAGLFVRENVRVAMRETAPTAFAYNWNGIVMQAHGGVLFVDEWQRQPTHLRNAFLGLVQNGEFQTGGSPAVRLDLVIVFGGNPNSAEPGSTNPQDTAFQDRTTLTPMNRSVDPRDGLKLAMVMTDENRWYQRELGTTPREEWVVEPVDVARLLPARLQRARLQDGIAGRYALYYGRGENRVAIAPWTLELIAYTAAVSRMVTDRNRILSPIERLKHTVGKPIFSDPIARLRAWLGETPVTQAQAEELEVLAGETGEGSGGLSPRDTWTDWLNRVLTRAAQLPGRTATPRMAVEVFNERLSARAFGIEADPSRHAQLRMALELVVERVIREKITQDLNRGIAAMDSGDLVDATYDGVIAQLVYLLENPGTADYSRAGSKAEFDAISQVYKKRIGRPLAIAEFFTGLPSQTGSSAERHRPLFDAIAAYYAESRTESADFRALSLALRQGSQIDPVQRDRLQATVRFMEERLGYNEWAFAEGMALLEYLRAQAPEGP